MSKIMEFKEAQEITTKICQSFGFTPCTLHWNDEEPIFSRAQVCNTKEKVTTKGWWFWKRSTTTTTYDAVVSASNWEDAVEKLETLLNGPAGRGRVEKADKLRQNYMTLLLDEKLES